MELAFEFELPPQRAFVTRSITEVLPLPEDADDEDDELDEADEFVEFPDEFEEFEEAEEEELLEPPPLAGF